MASNLGKVFVELSLDDKVYKEKLSGTLTSTEATAKGIETSWKALGVKSDAAFDAQRRAAENAYVLIKNSAASTAQDIVRAEEAKAAKITQINKQQHGEQIGLLQGLKANWIAISATLAGIGITTEAVKGLYELGAKAQQVEESFHLVAKSAKESSDDIIEAMKRASGGTVDDTDIMQKAVKGMILGLSGGEMTHIMETARLSARVAGEDVKTAYENITDAIATGLPKALKRYGLISKEEMAAVNAALKAGVEDVNLYSIAMANAEIQAAKYGEVHDTAAERIQKHRAEVQWLKETIGKGLVATMGVAIEVTKEYYANLKRLATGQATYHVEDAYDVTGWKETEEDQQKRIKTVEEAKQATLKDIKAKTEAAKASESAAKELESIRKKMAEDIAKQTLTEIEQIQKTAAEYRSKGATQVEVAEWVAVKTAEYEKKLALDSLKLNAEMEARRLKEHEDAATEYEKIILEQQEFKMSASERAAAKIDKDETITLGKLYTLYANEKIKYEELEKTKTYVTENAESARLHNTIESNSRIANARYDMLKDIKGMETEAYKLRLQQIETEKRKRINDANNTAEAVVMANRWATDEQKKAFIQMGKNSDDWKTGVIAGILEISMAHTTWGNTANAVTMSFVNESKSQLNDNLKAAFKGNFNEIGFDWQKLWDGATGTLSQKLVDMMTESATKKIILYFESSWAEGGANVLGIVNKVLGIGADLFGKNSDVTGTGASEPGYSMGFGDWMPEFASGGHHPGGWRIVGEKGPELEYTGPSQIFSNSQTNTILEAIAGQGRGGDTMLAHINPAEAAILKFLGGSGTINPRTGLHEYAMFANQDAAWAEFAKIWELPRNRRSLFPSGSFAWGNPPYDWWEWVYSPEDDGSDKRYHHYEESGGGSFLGNLIGEDTAQAIGMAAQIAAPILIGPLGTIATEAGRMIGNAAQGNAITTQDIAMSMGKIGMSYLLQNMLQGSPTGTGAVDSGYYDYGGAGYDPALGTGGGDFAAYGLEGGYEAGPYFSGRSLLSRLGTEAKNYAVKYAIRNALGMATGSGGDPGGGQMDIKYMGAQDSGLLESLAKQMQGLAGKATFAFSARNGLDYVPYDNFLINAHKGEAVITAKENRERVSEGNLTTPVQVNLTIDRRVLASVLLSMTKDGVKAIHTRGITTV